MKAKQRHGLRWISRKAMSELKVCPFCGGEAYKHKTHHEQMNGLELEKYNVFHVTCRDCGADIRSPENTPLFCEELWNRRTEPNEALTCEGCQHNSNPTAMACSICTRNPRRRDCHKPAFQTSISNEKRAVGDNTPPDKESFEVWKLTQQEMNGF